jgi:hypothetical protein
MPEGSEDGVGTGQADPGWGRQGLIGVDPFQRARQPVVQPLYFTRLRLRNLIEFCKKSLFIGFTSHVQCDLWGFSMVASLRNSIWRISNWFSWAARITGEISLNQKGGKCH